MFPTRYETDKGPVELRATWTRSGPDSYRVSQSQRAGKDWKPLWTMELKRKAKVIRYRRSMPWPSTIRTTSATGIASTVPPRAVTVVAMKSEL